MKTACIALTISGLVVSSVAGAVTPSEEYALQERCGKRAQEVFEHRYGKSGEVNTPDGQATASYRNHYNVELNKCFILITYLDLPFRKENASTSITLYDINEFKAYGRFARPNNTDSPTQCAVNDRICSSEKEWNVLIAKFMGD